MCCEQTVYLVEWIAKTENNKICRLISTSLEYVLFSIIVVIVLRNHTRFFLCVNILKSVFMFAHSEKHIIERLHEIEEFPLKHTPQNI